MIKFIFLFFCCGAFVACTNLSSRIDGRKPSEKQQFYKSSEHVYKKIDKRQLSGDLFIPTKGKGHAVVILIHGGGWANGSRYQMTPVAEAIVAQGIAVFNISYRFAPKSRWPAQIEDTRAAYSWVSKNAEKFDLDANRIGGYGYSAGAHLSLLLAYMTEEQVDVKAVAAGGSPVDLTQWPDSPLVNDLFGKPLKGNEELWQQASPINHVNKNVPPTFLYHGRHDWIVEVEQSRRLVAALKAAKVPVDYHESFFGHINTFLFDKKEVSKVIAFFKKHL